MTFAVLVESQQGLFEASLVGAPNVRVRGPTRIEALKSLQAELARRIEQGELTSLEVPDARGLLSLAGKYADDLTLTQICDDAYAERDRDVASFDEWVE